MLLVFQVALPGLPALAADDGMTTLSELCYDEGGTKYKVTVEFGEDAGIPADASLSVSVLPESGAAYESYVSQAADALNCSIENESEVHLFDISLVSSSDSGVTYQPADGSYVDVTVRLASSIKNELGVVHFGEETEVIDGSVSGKYVSFEATGFSVYALVDFSELTPEDPFIHDITSLDQQPLYISASTASGNKYFVSSGIVYDSYAKANVIKRTAQNSTAGAVPYCFEKKSGTDNQYYMYYMDANDTKQYVKLTKNTDAQYVSTSSNATVLTAGMLSDAKHQFYLSFPSGGTTYYLNLRKDENGKGFNGSDYSPTGLIPGATNHSSGSILTFRTTLVDYSDEVTTLNGKTYGIIWRDAYSSAFALSPEALSETLLAADNAVVRADPLGGEAPLVVRAEGDITMFTFRSAEGGGYYITTNVGGTVKYLKVTNSSALFVDAPDEHSVFSVSVGSGDYAGKLKITSFASGGGSLFVNAKDTTSSMVGYTTFNGFGGKSSISDAQKKYSYFYLAEPSDLVGDDLVSYTADKISVSEVKNGQKVVVYTRVWDASEKQYVYYGINHDGSLLRLHDEGETVRWTGTLINTMLWDFTEYYYWPTILGIPNGYYELRNTYSNKYLAPQHHNGQILSNRTIGVNLNGRRNRQQYTTILAWDNFRYDYSGLKVDNGSLQAVRMSKAQDFYFAVMHPEEGDLTTVNTIDHTNYGITMKMVEFPRERENSGGSRNGLQTEVLGPGTDVAPEQSNLKFPTTNLASSNLNGDGYPTATATGTSFSALFGNATEVNKLFLEEVYKESGYFQYDSTQNFATLLDPAGNISDTFTVYNELGTIETTTASQGHSQFMPYNDLDPTKISEYTNIKDVFNESLELDNPRLGEQLYSIPRAQANYHFGMEMEANFVQSKDGKDAWGHDIIFEFAGDDDMWLYVDGVLVLDLGGIHSALVSKINYRTGEVQIPSTTSATGNHATPVITNLRTIFANNYIERAKAENPDSELTVESPEVIEYLDGIFKEGTSVFKDYTAHTMKMFYMERGAGASNLIMRFNLTTSNEGQLLLSKEISGTDKQDYSGAEFPFQIYYKNQFNEFVTVKHSADYVDGKTPEQYEGVNFVNYLGTTDPVKYEAGYEGYDDVFFIKPGETADIQFPSNTVKYYIKECRVDQTVFDAVSANSEQLSPSNINGDYADFETLPEVIGDRKVVVYDNHVDQSALMTLSITKDLYKLQDTEDDRLHYEDDDTGFRFRVYIGKDLDDIDYYRFGDYYVKNANGEYCRYDYETGKFVSVGISDFSVLAANEDLMDDCRFTTSPSGAIDQIPTDFTVEIRDLFIDTKFKIIEQESDIPKGYDLINYTRRDETTIHDGEEANIGAIHEGENPVVVVRNHRGWGLTVEKYWSDDDFMLSHDNIYFGVYYNDALIPGTLRQMKTEVTADNPEAEYSLYYYFRELIEGAEFSEYVVKEVALTDPVVDENGYVTSYDSITQLGGSVMLNGGGIDSQTNTHEDHTYSVSYFVGTPTGANENVRTDEVTNARPGVKIVKTDSNGNALPDAVFRIRAEGILDAEFTSGSDGLVTIAYPKENVEYTLTEIETPSGYSTILDSIKFTFDGTDLTVTGDNNGAASVSNAGDDGMLTLSIENFKTDFKAVKRDAVTKDPVEGAVFALYRQVEGKNGIMRKDYYPMTGYENLVSDENGIIPLIDETLPVGVYYLDEISAASNYMLLDEDICFSVSEKGIVELVGEDDAEEGETEDEEGETEDEEEETTEIAEIVSSPNADNEFEITLFVNNERTFRTITLDPQVLVADFGLDINYNVKENNHLARTSEYEYIGIYSSEAYDDYGSQTAPKEDLLRAGVGKECAGKFGTLTLSANGDTNYSIGTMRFTGEDEFCLCAVVKKIAGKTLSEAERVYVFEKITFIPATTVYYEDDFVDDEKYIDGVESEETGYRFGEWSVATGEDEKQTAQAADLAGSDSANIFGFDPNYTAFGTFSNNSAHKVSVSNVNSGNGNKNWPYVEYTFAGTGFDLISLTNADSGMFTVRVYKTNIDDQGNITKGASEKGVTCDTYYGYSFGRLYIATEGENRGEPTLEETSMPLFKTTATAADTDPSNNMVLVSGTMCTRTKTYYDPSGNLSETPYYYDAEGRSTGTVHYVNKDDPSDVVETIPSGMSSNYTPNYAYAYAEGWILNGDASESIYQIPVIRVKGLKYGTYIARIEPRFSTNYGHWNTVGNYKYYDLYVDAFRVYNPAGVDEDGNYESSVISNAYKRSNEAFEQFMPLRDVLIGAETMGSFTADNIESHEGAVIVDGNIPLNTERLDDYKTYGPNHEVYLAKDMSVAFEICASEIPADIQMYMKKISEKDPVLRITYVKSDGTVLTSETEIKSATDMSYSIFKLLGKDNIKWTSQKIGKETVQKSGMLIITNIGQRKTGSGSTGSEGKDTSLISITNLKWTFKSIDANLKLLGPGNTLAVSGRSVAKATRALSAVKKSESSAPAVSTEPAVCADGKVTMTVSTGTNVEALVVRDEFGNVVDEDLLELTFEDLNGSERVWTVTVEEGESGEHVFTLAPEIDGLAVGQPIEITVTIEAETPSDPEDPGTTDPTDPTDPTDLTDPTDPADPGTDEPEEPSGFLAFIKKVRTIVGKFVDLIKRILTIFGIDMNY